MGWWWSSSDGADSRPESQSISTSIPTSATPSVDSKSSDADFYAAHPHLAPPSSAKSSDTRSTTSPDLSSSPALSSSPLADDAQLPRTMSCRAAFDNAFYCSSFGGHFNDIYRYGHLRSCSEHWSDFWFCMRVKRSWNSAETKQDLIQERYREKEERLKKQPNSEDIWRRRVPGEEVVNAFAKAEEVTQRAGGR